ncbi:MAG: hypothetical protein KJ057_16880, partial [Phycisphaerae bacterium]|nr:hypothetical protein [Phycisphaerae bacterium]
AYPPNEGYRWTQGEGFQLLGDLPGNRHDSRAEASSWDGSIIIGSSSSDRSRNREAFIWTPDNGMIGLGGLNENHIYSVAFGVSDDGRKVVGRTHAPDTQVAFLWTQTDGMVNLGVPANWSNTEAHGISPDGSVIVGYGEVTGTGFEAFRRTEAEGMVPLGVLDESPFDYHSEAHDASVNGWVIVGWSKFDRWRFATTWTPRRGLINLNEILTNEFGVDLGDHQLSQASAVSYDGKTIVGWGGHKDYSAVEAFLVRIPCIDDCDRCSFRERMTGRCKPQGDGTVKVVAKLSGGRVGATLTFCLDYYKAFAEATVNEDGRAKARFKRLPPGPHHLTLKECDAPAEVTCE